ncbi:hypothetical protein [Candidatus Oscillochloris fontis]|uniref:hypothetical protein n=1 Tax=Candidatus Oscillochloris fontis TaxID=2496868 RepID=UPI00101D505F|nr:hypothetical protein [Candidatus Oscillochloris fontis]
MDINWFLIGLGVTAAVVLLFRDWRLTITALLLNYIIRALFMFEQQSVLANASVLAQIGTLVAVKVITGVAVTAILAITALTFSRDYGLEALDEFGLSELRRAARAAQRQRATDPFHLSDYVVPFWAGVLALFASATLPWVYAIAPTPAADFAWYWLLLTGVFTIATASDLLKIGLGLLLCASGVDVLYTIVVSTPNASGLNIFPMALLSHLHILLALAIAYLSGLLYGRLKTLDLNELYKR